MIFTALNSVKERKRTKNFAWGSSWGHALSGGRGIYLRVSLPCLRKDLKTQLNFSRASTKKSPERGPRLRREHVFPTVGRGAPDLYEEWRKGRDISFIRGRWGSR